MRLYRTPVGVISGLAERFARWDRVLGELPLLTQLDPGRPPGKRLYCMPAVAGRESLPDRPMTA
jgi:hypothetical protein